MNKFEKEVEQTIIANETKMLNDLEKTYTRALADIKTRVRLLQAREQTQAVIYQINYQNALEEQINGILAVLKQDNITSVTSFLTTMYEDGYIGLQYALNKTGVPVVTAFSQDELAKSLFQKINDMTFADRIGVNMNVFKEKVKGEITRGIANNSTYLQIAEQLSLVTNEELSRSFTIARTEGHRVTTEAKLVSMERAKAQGADLVSQWDATLDGATRKHHRQLDGVYVEVGEYFEIGGRKTKGPGKFGRPEEDINCRCILLSRPRWAVDKRRVKPADITDEYGNEYNKLIEVDNYEAYKKGHYKILDEDPEIEAVIARANERIASYRK